MDISHSFSIFQQLPPCSDLCRNAITNVNGDDLINDCDRDYLDPNAGKGKGDNQMVLFENHLPTVEGGMSQGQGPSLWLLV